MFLTVVAVPYLPPSIASTYLVALKTLLSISFTLLLLNFPQVVPAVVAVVVYSAILMRHTPVGWGSNGDELWDLGCHAE
jgi:hypothetical protein